MARRTRLYLAIARVIDVVALPFTALAGAWLMLLRLFGLQYLPGSKRTLLSIGVLPVRDHYYEPMFNPKHLRYPLSIDRSLPAVDMNVAEQLSFLAQFTFQEELKQFPLNPVAELKFHYLNASFEAGDAEYLYSLLRLIKPKRLIEIGSGYSTLIARGALDRNLAESSSFECEHICIEPYEQPWLEKLGVNVTRRRVEECGTELFSSLRKDDVLFIDSSHVIRPQGDVVFEYLELLPILHTGVFVHIHDIFTPRDYPHSWIVEEIRLWNEQYLLEAFLSFNSQFRVIGALNFLTHHYPKEVGERFPILRTVVDKKEPGSFWIVKR